MTPYLPTAKGRVKNLCLLLQKWEPFLGFQPLWDIRDYFGEKIAFYFAWLALYNISLIIPSCAGLIGLAYSLWYDKTSIENGEMEHEKNAAFSRGFVLHYMGIFNSPFSPWFALIISLWGTVFVEQWKRTSHRLRFDWDVSNFEMLECDRPQFRGSERKRNPVTNEDEWYYPIYKLYLKYSVSLITLLFMVGTLLTLINVIEIGVV